MKYTIYQTTNNINGHIYIGCHRTESPNDKYLGSGHILKKAIKKHGKENFSKTVLFIFDNEKDMLDKEKEIVNKEFVGRGDTYNAKVGGIGGFDHLSREECVENGHKGQKKLKERNLRLYGLEYDPTQYRPGGDKAHMDKMRSLAFTDEANNKRKETFKRKKHQQGHRNSNYGKHWYTDPEATSVADRKGQKTCRPGEQPEDWITTTEWRARKKAKNKKAPPRRKAWYNDGEKEYMLFPDDPKIPELSKGRKPSFVSFFSQCSQ